MEYKGYDIALIRRQTPTGYTHGWKVEIAKQSYGAYIQTTEPNFETSGIIQQAQKFIDKLEQDISQP